MNRTFVCRLMHCAAEYLDLWQRVCTCGGLEAIQGELVRERGSALLAGGASDGEIQGGDLEEE